jgi:hypothetical protein
MQLLRWNNADPILGAQRQTNVFDGEGLDVAECSLPSGRGRSIFLTAFIDQAMALRRKSRVTYLESVSPSSASFIPMGGRQAHAKLTTQRR